MAAWRLDDGVVLRSWDQVPWAYCRRGDERARALTRDEFATALLCDGARELEDSPALRSLAERGVALPCGSDDAPRRESAPWRELRVFPNRYFPRLNWMVTGRCNMNCLHCFNAADGSPSTDEFSFEQGLDLLDQCTACGIRTVTLTGGEPLLHPRLPDLVRSAAERGIAVAEVNTNGTYVTDALLDSLEGCGQRPTFKVSFDGAGCHDWLRNHPGAERDALAAIDLLVARGFRACAQMNLHGGNLDALAPTAQLLEDRGVEGLRVIRTTESPRWRENGRGSSLSWEGYYDAALAFSEEWFAAPRAMSVVFWHFLRVDPKRRAFVRDACATERDGAYRGNEPACRTVRGTVAVGAAGEVMPCAKLAGAYAAQGISLGNVHERPLADLLREGAYFDQATATVADVRARDESCAACPFWEDCRGGCRALAFNERGDYLRGDPAACAYFHGGYAERTAAAFDRIAEASGLRFRHP